MNLEEELHLAQMKLVDPIIQGVLDLREHVKDLEAQLKLADKAMSMLDSLYSEEGVIECIWHFSIAAALEDAVKAYRTARQKV